MLISAQIYQYCQHTTQIASALFYLPDTPPSIYNLAQHVCIRFSLQIPVVIFCALQKLTAVQKLTAAYNSI